MKTRRHTNLLTDESLPTLWGMLYATERSTGQYSFAAQAIRRALEMKIRQSAIQEFKEQAAKKSRRAQRCLSQR